MREGRHYLSYLPYFPAASAVFYGAMGYRGLIVLPMIAGLVAVWLTYRFLQSAAPAQAVWGAAALGLGTPLIIYSGVFWDHSLTVALAAAGLALAIGEMDGTRRPRLVALLAAGGLFGLGTWLRNEMYLLAAAGVLVWPVVASRARIRGLVALGLGAGTVTGLQWLVNLRLYGSLLGVKGQGLVTGRVSDAATAAGSSRGSAAWLLDKFGNFYYQFFSPDFYSFNMKAVGIALAMGAALLTGGFLIRAGVRRQSRWLVGAGSLLAAATVLITVSGRASISGLLPAAPFIVLLLIGGRPARWEWYVWGVAVLFAGAVVITGTHGGLQWGPRYLLPIVPPLVWLTAATLERVRRLSSAVWPATRVAAGALLAVSIAVQVAGIEFVEFSIARNARVNDALRAASGEAVVTSLEWLVLGAGALYFEKPLMYVTTVQDFESMVRHFADRRVSRWSYIPQSGGAFGHLIVERWTSGGAWRFRTAGDGLVNGIRVVTYEGVSGLP
jgi:hypothetical protein